MIKANAHKYSVSAMCSVLNIARATYYYEAREKTDESSLIKSIKEIFRWSRNNYGTRKIKKELAKKGEIVSRRRIGRKILSFKTIPSSKTLIAEKYPKSILTSNSAPVSDTMIRSRHIQKSLNNHLLVFDLHNISPFSLFITPIINLSFSIYPYLTTKFQ